MPTVCTVSFCALYALRVLGQGKWGTEGRKGGGPLFLSSLSLALLGAIIAVMKAHLSPSLHNLIIHIGGCSSSRMRMSAHCLEDGRVCAWYEDGCLNAISDAEIDLLVYLLSRMSENWSHLIQRGNVFCVWWALWGQAVGVVLDQWTWITFRGQVK